MILPLSCSGRGTCNSEGRCECWGANLRDNCEEEPHCRFWNVDGVNGSDWSGEGVKLVVFDRGSGGGVCATTHLTDFAIVSDVLARPDEGFVFFEDADLDLAVHLPLPLTLEEILARLRDLVGRDYVAIILCAVVPLLLMAMAAWYDDKRAYVEFFPRWHERLGQGGLGLARLRRSKAYQAFAFQLSLLLDTNHLLGVFFVLPSIPSRRTQRLMTCYLVVLGKFAVLTLFYGQQHHSRFIFYGSASTTIFWGLLVDLLIVAILKVVSVRLFRSAAFKEADVYQDRQKVLKRRNRQRHTEGQWDLMLRQTVPKGEKEAAVACAQWKRGGGYAFTEPDADQYFDARRLRDLPQAYFGDKKQGKAVAGKITCRLVLTRHGLLGLQDQVATIEWRQSSALTDQTVKGLQVMSAHLKWRLQRRVLPEDEAMLLEAFGGLRRGSSSLLQGGMPSDNPSGMRKPQGEREELFCLGAAAPNDFGGLSGWSLAIGGSVVKAELYLLNYTGVKQMELAAAKRSASMDAGAVSIVLETIGISVPDDSALHAFKREEESENSSDEEEDKDATKKTLSSKFKKSASGLARNVGAKVLKSHVAHADEEGRALQIYESYKVQALRKVPARCLVRQADGSVGFFVQPKVLTLTLTLTLSLTLTLTLTVTRCASSTLALTLTLTLTLTLN